VAGPGRLLTSLTDILRQEADKALRSVHKVDAIYGGAERLGDDAYKHAKRAHLVEWFRVTADATAERLRQMNGAAAGAYAGFFDQLLRAEQARFEREFEETCSASNGRRAVAERQLLNAELDDIRESAVRSLLAASSMDGR
jgi:hypothetical protein